MLNPTATGAKRGGVLQSPPGHGPQVHGSQVSEGLLPGAASDRRIA